MGPTPQPQGETKNASQAETNKTVARLLMEYEEHLRNTLKKGLDAESYSLHTFEALLTQSMENLGKKPLTVGWLSFRSKIEPSRTAF